MIAAMTPTTKLSGWLIMQGAPELPEGHSYRLLLEPANLTTDYSPSKVTALIYDGDDTLVSQASEITRDSSARAAVTAARHAFEELP